MAVIGSPVVDVKDTPAEPMTVYAEENVFINFIALPELPLGCGI